MVSTGVQLYRYMLRTIRQLPEESQMYYKHYVRQCFNSHHDETDSDRIQQIIARSLEDSQWILKKYKGSTGKTES